MSEHSQNSSPESRSITAEHFSPLVQVGLGRSAVAVAMMEGGANAIRHTLPPDEIPEFFREMPELYSEEGLEGAKEAHIAYIRKQLEAMNAGQKGDVNTIFSQYDPSEWLKTALHVDDETPDYVQSLIAKDNQGQYIADSQAVLNFLEWHNFKLAEQQEKLDAMGGEIKSDYKQSFRGLINDGWVPASAESHLERLGKTRIVIDDGFDTDMKQREGYTEIGSNEWIVVSQFSSDLRHVYLHEFTHVIDGRGKEGFATGMYRLFGDGFGGRAMNEAFTEHTALVMLRGGRFDRVSPGYARRKNAAYEEERELLATLANQGVKDIDIRLFSEAYFESDEAAEVLGDNSAKERLRSAINEAFPFADVIQEISELKTRDEVQPYYEALWDRVDAYNVSRQEVA